VKILITGGYGFIGSHVVERFEKEDYEVFVIDNLSTGNSENVTCKHKFYKYDVEDKACEDVFKRNNIDIVIHLAAQINVSNSMEDPFSDTQTNVLGLVNMLELATKYKVKNFLFASSAAVYGHIENQPINEDEQCNPNSPYGMSKYLGEQYCKKWTELYGLNTSCFRFSSVYGPRQALSGEGDAISTYMKSLMENGQLILNGDGEQSRDFIYVSDLTDALFRASESNISGVYNLSTNSRTSLNDLIPIMGTYVKINDIKRKEAKKEDIKYLSLDNSKLKRAIDWVPIISMEEGIKKTFSWYSDTTRKKESVPHKHVAKSKLISKEYIPYIENIFVFILLIFLTQVLNIKAIQDTIDLKLVYIVVMGLMYGRNQSVISAILSCILFTTESLLTGKTFLLLTLDTSFIFKFCIYILVGLVIGYIIDKHYEKEVASKISMDTLQKKYNFLQEIYTETHDSKLALEDQVVNSKDSFGKIYGVVKTLDSLEPQYIYKESVNLLKDLLNVESLSIYSVDKTRKFLRLIVNEGTNDFINQKTIALDDLMDAKGDILNGKIYINKNLNTELPMVISPILNEKGEFLALIMIHSIEFERLSLYFQNLVAVATGLIQTSILRAYQYEEAIHSKRYIKNTMILKKDFFENIVSINKNSMEKNFSEFAMLKISNTGSDIKAFSDAVSDVIRLNDFMGMAADNSVILLLSNSSSSDTKLVINRLQEKRIEAVEFSEDYI
jgi:nucleoside-diphosphate-sugar epimerase